MTNLEKTQAFLNSLESVSNTGDGQRLSVCQLIFLIKRITKNRKNTYSSRGLWSVVIFPIVPADDVSNYHNFQNITPANKSLERNSRSWNWPYNMKLAQWAVFFFKVIVGKRQGSASSEKRAREGTREKIKHRSTCCSASKSNPLSQPITSNYSV